MTDTLSLELDVAACPGADLIEMIMEITRPYESVTYRVIAEDGPNSFPIVRFVGSKVDMFEFVLEYCAGDRRWAAELLMA